MSLSVSSNPGGFASAYPSAMLVMRPTNHRQTWGNPVTLIRDVEGGWRMTVIVEAPPEGFELPLLVDVDMGGAAAEDGHAQGERP